MLSVTVEQFRVIYCDASFGLQRDGRRRVAAIVPCSQRQRRQMRRRRRRRRRRDVRLLMAIKRRSTFYTRIRLFLSFSQAHPAA